MKKSTSTTDRPGAAFVYSSFLDELDVNNVYPKYDLDWDSVRYRESHLSEIKDRDRSVEFRLRYINTLMLEYFELHHWVISVDKWDNEYSYLIDTNPELSKATLLQALDIAEIVVDNLFKAGHKANREYCILALSLFFRIHDELKYFGIHRNPMKYLKSLQYGL